MNMADTRQTIGFRNLIIRTPRMAYKRTSEASFPYFISFKACFTTCSTGSSGCSSRIATTTFADGAGENPSMVSALTASSFTAASTAFDGSAPTCNSCATPLETILSLKSTMMRCAVQCPSLP